MPSPPADRRCFRARPFKQLNAVPPCSDEPGARASHLTPILDFNEDGISDITVPFADIETGKKYICTCREGHEVPGEQRVSVF